MTASPERVARVYLRAALTGDCTLTAELTLPHTGLPVGAKTEHVPAPEAGRSEECAGFEMDTHGSADDSMPTGWQPWSLCFVETRAGWRLFDQGQG